MPFGNIVIWQCHSGTRGFDHQEEPGLIPHDVVQAALGAESGTTIFG